MAVELTASEQLYYQYASISGHKSEVRLLTIEPAESNESPLHLSLTTHNLNDTVPEWDAISYYWGNSETTQRVIIDGKLLQINQNAFSALSHCRDRNRPRKVWIDQICINQNDEQERFEQIMLMGRIYREAQCVVAYISDALPGTEILFAYLNIIGYEPKPWSLSWWKPWTAVAPTSPWKSMLGSDRKFPAQTWERLRPFHDHVRAIVEAYSEVLRLPWFRRTWIVQEAGLAQKLHIQCSFLTASWSSFMIAHDLVMHGPKRELDSKMGHGSRSACAIDMIRCRRPGRRPLMKLVWNEFLRKLRRSSWTRYWSLVCGATSRLVTVEYPDLLGLMRHLRYQECTDERDKVLGLLGLAKPDFVHTLTDTAHSDGRPYKETISFLSFHFAVWHIMHTNTLDVLMSTCFGASAHDDLPYWVPDWSQEAALCDTDWKFPLKRAPHQSGTQYPASAEFIPNEKAIIVRGILLDVVDEVVEQSITVQEFDNPNHLIWNDWKAFAMRPTPCSDPYKCDTGRYEAYWRTLVYDTDNSGGRATEKTGIALTEWLERGTTTK